MCSDWVTFLLVIKDAQGVAEVGSANRYLWHMITKWASCPYQKILSKELDELTREEMLSGTSPVSNICFFQVNDAHWRRAAMSAHKQNSGIMLEKRRDMHKLTVEQGK